MKASEAQLYVLIRVRDYPRDRRGLGNALWACLQRGWVKIVRRNNLTGRDVEKIAITDAGREVLAEAAAGKGAAQ